MDGGGPLAGHLLGLPVPLQQRRQLPLLLLRQAGPGRGADAWSPTPSTAADTGRRRPPGRWPSPPTRPDGAGPPSSRPGPGYLGGMEPGAGSVAHRRAELRRRLHRHDRGHPAQPGGPGAGRLPRRAPGPLPPPGAGLRGGRRVPGRLRGRRRRRAGPVHPGGRGLHPRRDAATTRAAGPGSAPTPPPASPSPPPPGSTGSPAQAWAVMAVGTCAAYGGIHGMAGNPTGAMGLADYLGLGLALAERAAHRQPARLPHPARQLHRDPALPAPPAGGGGAAHPPRPRHTGPGGCSARPSTRAATGPATTSRATSPAGTGRRSASSSSGAGGRWSTATSASGAG